MQDVVIQIVALLLAITVHETAHAWTAYRLGDPTARLQGRLSFSPLAHIDLFGTIIFPLLLILMKSSFLIGWAKPVPINPSYFKNPRKGAALVSLSGPASNLLTAFVAAIVLRLGISFFRTPGPIATPLGALLLASVVINTVLAVFNLIPIPPLDGGHFLEGVLPVRAAYSFRKIEPFGMVIIFILLYFGVLHVILRPIQMFLLSLFL